jgi:hypothetical protein
LKYGFEVQTKGGRFMQTTFRLAVAVAVLVGTVSAFAASYPVSGRWTYNYSSEKGPAKQCGTRYMDFRGERRFDVGGSVPDYRNVSVTSSGSDYAIVDELFNGQIRGHVDYTLHLIDGDHLEMTLASGSNVRLRRCG